MAQILSYADPHVHAHKGNQERLGHCLEALEWVFRTARDRGIRDVVCAGDLFHDRRRIDIYTYLQTFRVFERFPDLNHWMLLGNHDLWYHEKADVSSVTPIGALPHVTVIDRPCTRVVAGLPVDFLPFTHDPPAAIREHFAEKSPVLVAHVAVDGSVLNFHYRTKSDVSVEHEGEMMAVGRDVFDGWRRVFLGHYHGAQRLTDRVEYIGSTLQLSFGEAGQEKHIVILDTETLDRQYVVNDFSPKHIIGTPEEVAKHRMDGNFVRIHVDDVAATDVIEMRRRLLSDSPGSQVTFVQDRPTGPEASPEQSQKFDLAEGDVLERYIETVGCAGLDPARLLSMGKEICLAS